MSVSQRFFWRQAPRFGIYRVNWDILRPTSFVTISASEARADGEQPGRFIGGARPVITGSIAAHQGFLEFSMWWTLVDVGYLDIWADVTVIEA
jgi:hypothetical protein